MRNIAPGNCPHPDFACECDVNRLADSGRYMIDVRVKCAACGTRFSFIGVRGGMAFDEPRASPFGLELRAPIEPFDPPRPEQN